MAEFLKSLWGRARGGGSGAGGHPVDRARLDQMLAYARQRGLSSKGCGDAPYGWIGASIQFVHTEHSFTLRVDSPPLRAGDVRTVYPAVFWSWMPHHLGIYLVEGEVEYRASHDGIGPREAMPLARSPADLAEIARCFDYWYDKLGLPGALDQPDEVTRARLRPSGDAVRDVATFLEHDTATAFADLFDEGGPVVWVDWRDEDDLIVDRVAAALGLPELSASFEDTRGDLVIRHGGAEHRVRYAEPWAADRDTTIIGLNQALMPEHELRLCQVWSGSDTVALMALPRASWHAIEQAHPGRHRAVFAPILHGTEIFGSA